MNNLKKIGLTAIAASLATVSAHAADFSVSGGASISYTSNNIVGIGGGGNGNPWSMSDTVNFAASGELDNGWTVNYTMGLDGSKTAAGAAFEDRTLAIGLGDMGTITMMGQDGSSVVGSMDDKLPTAYEESWNFSGGPGTGTSVGNNAFKYSYGGVDGLNIEASYVPSTATAEEGSTDIGITYTGMEGLTVGLATGTDNTAGSAAEVDEQAMYVTYAYDAFTFGYQSNESDSNAAGADSDFSGGPGTGTTVGNNAWKYAYSGVEGLTVEASYVPSTGVQANGSTDMGITYSGIDGLTIGVAAGTDDTGGSTAAVDESAMYVTYAYDAFTFGVQSNESDSNAAGADSEFSGWAVSYAVSDDISVSLAQTEIEREGTSTVVDATTEHTAISASYTMGSMALKATRADVDNAGGNSDRDGEAYAVELSFAF